MKTWLIIVSVVAVLLAASTGVGFWMLTDAKAELTDIKAELTDTRAELIGTQEKLEENFGNWQETELPWAGYSSGEEITSGKYPWCEGIEETISDLEQRVEELEWTVRDLESQLQQLESTLHIHGIY